MNEILIRLDALALKLGQTAAELWPHAVRHTAIEATATIIICGLALIFGAALLTFGLVRGERTRWEESPLTIAPCLFGGIILLLGSITGVANGPETIAKALEPVGYTVKSILKP